MKTRNFFTLTMRLLLYLWLHSGHGYLFSDTKLCVVMKYYSMEYCSAKIIFPLPPQITYFGLISCGKMYKIGIAGIKRKKGMV